MPEDIAQFAAQLVRLDATQRCGEMLFMLQGAFEHTWAAKRQLQCRDRGIPVPPPRHKALHPIKCEVSDADICFTFILGDFASSTLPELAEFQVRVTGLAEYTNCIVRLEDHWRVDTHDFAGKPREPHPYIHFQRGGHAQDAWAESQNFIPGPALPDREGDYWQGLLQSPGPRIPFPPLCPILAIDFVISQHDGDVWTQLRNIPEYRAVIETAQTRLWTPFFEGLSQIDRRRQWLGSLVI